MTIGILKWYKKATKNIWDLKTTPIEKSHKDLHLRGRNADKTILEKWLFKLGFPKLKRTWLFKYVKIIYFNV